MTLQLLHFDEKNSKSTCQKEISFFLLFCVEKKMHLKYLTTSEKKLEKTSENLPSYL